MNFRRRLPEIRWLYTVCPTEYALAQRVSPKRLSTRLARHVLECVYLSIEIHIMRTNIVIDDKLMRDTLRATGLKTKREAVEEGLRLLLRLKRQAGIRRLRGKVNWQGDLNAMRSDK